MKEIFNKIYKKTFSENLEKTIISDKNVSTMIKKHFEEKLVL
jgi:hypothetical protein